MHLFSMTRTAVLAVGLVMASAIMTAAFADTASLSTQKQSTNGSPYDGQGFTIPESQIYS
jgi:hypothetical protein